MGLNLRDYQEDARSAVHEAWAGGMRSPAIVLPTGAGKTVVFSSVAEGWAGGAHRYAAGEKVLVLAHREELIDQAAKTMRAMVPGLDVGVVRAGLNETDRQVIVGSVQTVTRDARRAQLDGVGLLITDECHHGTADTYRAIYSGFPEARMLGVTATMMRAGKGRLGDVWDKVVAKVEILDLIRAGYLANVKGKRVRVDDLDLDRVKVARGDYQDSELGEALEQSLAPSAIARAYVEETPDQAGVLFAPTVSSAAVMAEALSEAGIIAAMVDGSMKSDERNRIYAAYRRGDIQVLTNCALLTEGWDAPWCSVVVVARPTKSQGLYIQMVGRGLRLHPHKKFATVLDVVGATEVHSLCGLAVLTGAREVRDGEDVLEAAERELADGAALGEPVMQVADGKLRISPIDLFGRSTFRWNQTNGGIWYINTGMRYWMILPGAEPGTYDVAWQATGGDGMQAYGGWGGFTTTDIPDLELAMSWGNDSAASDDNPTLAERNRSWHRTKPSEKQVAYAGSLGITVTPEMKKLDVANAIDEVLAGRTLDGRMLKWLLEQGREMPAPAGSVAS